MYRNILVHLDGRADAAGRLRLAIALASRCGAGLTGLHVRPPADVEPAPRFLLDEAVERRTARLEAHAHDAEAAFSREIGQCTRATWRCLEGDVVEGICRCACFADLVILGQSEWLAPAHRHPLPIAHAVIRRCGRPVLVVPADYTGGAPRRVLIGWNGSREVVRAVNDALPLLRSAHSIDIMADATGDDEGGGALARHLADHGCSSTPNVILEKRCDEPRRALSYLVRSGDHDLLVVGGSTRPTWHETLFGGVTRALLMQSKIPVLAAI
jgi:nucleotide-binding universal stress UspA family protein